MTPAGQFVADFPHGRDTDGVRHDRRLASLGGEQGCKRSQRSERIPNAGRRTVEFVGILPAALLLAALAIQLAVAAMPSGWPQMRPASPLGRLRSVAIRGWRRAARCPPTSSAG